MSSGICCPIAWAYFETVCRIKVVYTRVYIRIRSHGTDNWPQWYVSLPSKNNIIYYMFVYTENRYNMYLPIYYIV